LSPTALRSRTDPDTWSLTAGVLIAYGASASYETAPRLLQALVERHPGVEKATAVKSVNEIVSGLNDGSVVVGALPGHRL
jgi:hypothetical protein